MAVAFWALLGWLGTLALLVLPASSSASTSTVLLLFLLLTSIGLELLCALAPELELHRTSPALVLFAYLSAEIPFAAGVFCALAGPALLLFSLGAERERVKDSGKSLLPLAAAGAYVGYAVTETLAQQVVALEIYVVLALLLPCRRAPFKQDLTLLVTLPAVVLGLLFCARTWAPGVWLFVPLLLLLSNARSGTLSSLLKLRKAESRAQKLRHEALRRGQLLTRQDQQLSLLDALSAQLAEAPQVEPLSRLLLDESFRITAAEGGCVFLDGQPGQIRLLGQSEKLPAPPAPGRVGRVARAQGSMFAEPYWCEFQSHLLVPLGQSGMLYLGRRQPEPFPGFLEEFFAVVARQFSAALMALRRLEQLQASNAEIAKVNQKLALSLKQLEESQEQLVRSSQWAAAGRLAANAAHELNTPLGAIKLSTETALAFLQGPPPATESLKLVLKSVERCREVTDRLLLYSRPRMDQRREPFDLSTVVQDSLGSLQPFLRGKEIELTLDLDDSIRVVGDPQDCYWAVTNVLKNAVEALAEQQQCGGKIALRGRVQEQTFLLTIEDSGPGMAPEIADKIFEPFFSTKKIGQGNGLGLSISRRNLRSWQGELRLGSPTLGGACFVLELPLAESS